MKTGKKFIPYIMYGFPSVKESFNKAMDFLKIADLMEVGYPFSDPIADGKTIHSAATAAIKKGVTFDGYLDYIKKLKTKTLIPIYSMTYFNPILNYGIEKFMKSAIDGFIIPDLLPEESGEMLFYAKKHEKKSVFIVTPNTHDDRIKYIGKLTTGFIYYVTYSGVTGSKVKLDKNVLKKIPLIKKLSNREVYVGFGIRTASDLKTVLKFADGGIIGSAILENKISPKDIILQK
ncbi:MAG TPA: tryptophan synthase subunit alpha [bacterium]|nr:tryptophan synthase subunit alpha [bacterium]HPN30706.1 tryptophan synthase subunit alpha [bacterium]